MYSLIKGYISSSRAEEEQESAFTEKAVHSGQLKAKRAGFRSARSKSESSAARADGNTTRYLSWENVSFLGQELRKTVSRGFQWIASPSLESEMSLKIKRKPPEGTKEYLVDATDTLAKIALSFDTTPSELTRINKLASRMLFPGQTLFVPDKRLEASTPPEEPSSSVPVTKPPQPFLNKENGHMHNGEHETVKLTKDVSWEEEEEEVTEHYLKIYAKYITDGQGIANGVLLITPHSVMFKPNVSDPLVMDRGQDTYSIATLMTSVTSAAMYTDIAAMAIHDPLKPGRFYLDAATAQTMSRQNSCTSDTESASPSLCKSCDEDSTNLNEITEPSLSSQEDKVKHLKSESQTPDSTQSCMCNAVNGSPAVDDEDIKNVIHELLNSIIDQIAECEDKHVGEKIAKSKGSPILMQENFMSRDIHSVSPVSEDSGIGCSLSHGGDGKAEDTDLTEHLSHNQVNDSAVTQASNDSTKTECDENQSAHPQEHSEGFGPDHSSSSSLFAALSSNVKYWLGQGSYGKHEQHGSESDDDNTNIVPKPAAPLNHQPLYLCLRISKKHWCRHHNAAGIILQQGEELHDRDQKRREYWFAIPPSRTEQVYRFFQQWCPNIHNATDEESDDDLTSPGCCAPDEEGLHLVETFYSNSPPTHSHPKISRALSDSDVLKVKKGFRGFSTKPGKATKVMTFPKPSPDFIEDVLPDMDAKSEILREEHLRTLNSNLPSRTIGHCWVLVYSTFQHGFSLKTLYRKMEFYDTPVLLVVMDDAHQIFGALCSCPLKVSEGFYGTGESFLYKFNENAIQFQSFGWSGDNHFFIKGSKDSLAIGSGGGNFGLWLDEDLYHGSSHPCTTYNNVQLSSREDFLCSGLEAWTFV